MRKTCFVIAFVLLLAAAGAFAQAASTTSQTLTVTAQAATINADGSASVALLYTNGNGQTVILRTLYVDNAGAHVTDDHGNTITTPAPAALVSAITSFNTQLSSLVSTGAAAGKLNL